MGSNVTDIDVRGLSCPEPVIQTKKVLDEGPMVVTVLTDSPVSAENIRRLVENNYNYSCMIDEKEDEFVLTIKKEG